MASTNRSVSQTCWRCLTRVKANAPTACHSSPRAYISTTRTHHQTESTPTSSTPSANLPPATGALQPPPGTQPNGNEILGIEYDHEDQDSDIKNYIRSGLIQLANQRNIPIPPRLANARGPHLPKPVQSLYLHPLKRPPTHNIPVATLQLRSFSARNLELMADFALRAAYFLHLPAKGPVPLPRITNRWTVPRSVFVHKKSQENWERVTMRRLVQIVDGDVEVVQRWLAFVRKWTWYGVGMKANVYEYESLPEQRSGAERGDADAQAVDKGMASVDWSLFGRRAGLEGEAAVAEYLTKQGFGRGTVAEAVKAVGGEGHGGYTARKLREGRKVRRTADSRQEEREWAAKVRDEMRVHREGPALEKERARGIQRPYLEREAREEEERLEAREAREMMRRKNGKQENVTEGGEEAE